MPMAALAAALIAAIALAVLAAAGVYALVRLARLITEASRALAEFRTRSDLMLGRANSAVDRAHEQLARTDAITANMDEVSTNIAELTADVSTLTGAVRSVLGGPFGQVAGFAFGVRRAVALRRPGAAPLGRARTDPGALAIQADAAAAPAALPVGRNAAPRQAGRQRVRR
ncbi:MAG TPA: DUF948 domain-containing protein [Streptosporangiaceae bacterium]|nr:DUF948 domain-containing protein [Streptosporangiaceae bacterium]